MIPIQFGGYGFRFLRDTEGTNVQIDSIGIEEQRSSDYGRDGLTRRGMDGHFVFQYTLSGFGAIRIKNHTVDLKPGQAFFVRIPDDHRYYLPESSRSWTFIFINLYGPLAEQCWKLITDNHGQLLSIDADSCPIRTLMEIHLQASNLQILDGYRTSDLAYRFLMECCRYYFAAQNNMDGWPASIRTAVAFIQKNYDNFRGLDQIAQHSGLSKYHFLRLFQRTTGLSPVQYLTKIRMDRAVYLLRHTKKSVEVIAQEIGYANSSYFCKVFRRVTGITPHQFRIDQDQSNHITF
jgi:AraC-like DNA-binding protein